MNTGDMVLSSATHAAIWTGAALEAVPDAQASLDFERMHVTVRVGVTPVLPTGRLILNAPDFAGWTGSVSISDVGTGVARDGREDNASEGSAA